MSSGVLRSSSCARHCRETRLQRSSASVRWKPTASARDPGPRAYIRSHSGGAPRSSSLPARRDIMFEAFAAAVDIDRQRRDSSLSAKERCPRGRATRPMIVHEQPSRGSGRLVFGSDAEARRRLGRRLASAPTAGRVRPGKRCVERPLRRLGEGPAGCGRAGNRGAS